MSGKLTIQVALLAVAVWATTISRAGRDEGQTRESGQYLLAALSFLVVFILIGALVP